MDDRQLIEDLLSALEYHTEQTRPIEFSKVAIEAAREYLRKPPQRTWQGLTDEEVVSLKMLGRDLEFVSMTALRRFARDIEQTLKEKNNG